jgi:hypothetical protein
MCRIQMWSAGASLASDKTDTTLLVPARSSMPRERTITGPATSSFCAEPDYSAAKQAADWRDDMLDRNYRTAVGRLIWYMGVAVALALSLLAVLALGKRVYMLQEALVGMLLVAISVTVILIISVCFVLFQAGIRQAIQWMTTGMSRLAKLSHRHVAPPETILPPPVRR